MLGIYYITSRRLALKLFTGLTEYDLCVLDMLAQQNIPCHYGRLHGLLVGHGHFINYNTFGTILRNGIDNGLITRTQIAGNVVYAITLEGKKLLHAFARELDRIVAERVRQYGNGFDLE